jgi:hypothetical protein
MANRVRTPELQVSERFSDNGIAHHVHGLYVLHNLHELVQGDEDGSPGYTCSFTQFRISFLDRLNRVIAWIFLPLMAHTWRWKETEHGIHEPLTGRVTANITSSPASDG